jgi:hypothetical protein
MLDSANTKSFENFPWPWFGGVYMHWFGNHTSGVWEMVVWNITHIMGLSITKIAVVILG